MWKVYLNSSEGIAIKSTYQRLRQFFIDKSKQVFIGKAAYLDIDLIIKGAESVQRAEFEEKDFEQPLNVQILDSNHILWTPGQVFEYFIGVDAALSVINPDFWRFCGFQKPLEGVILRDYNLGWIWKTIGRVRQLPPFRLNLFIQAKRPEYLKGVNAAYHSHGIVGDYYRFHLSSHQQKALERIASRVGNKALIVYASPVFHTYQDLYTHIQNKSLIQNSTFIKVLALNGHTKWIYDQPGARGLACSEVVPISDVPLQEQIKRVIQQIGDSKAREQNPFEHLTLIANEIVEAFTAEAEDGNPIAQEYFRR